MDEKTKIIDKAQKLVQKGSIDKAIAEYKKVVTNYPKDTIVRLRIGDLYVKLGMKEEAIKEYGEVAKINTQGGFNLKAIAVYKQILKLDENQLDIHLKLSDLYAKQKLMADAVASLSVLVSFYEKKGKSNEAIDVLKKMIIVDPQNVGTRLKLADYYVKKGFAKDSLTEYETAFSCLIKDGKIDKAEKVYEDLYNDNRRNINIIEGLVEVNRIKGANIHFVRYCKELANLYKEKGDDEKRTEIYKKIHAIAPEDDDALNALGLKQTAETHVQKPAPSKDLSDDKKPQEPIIAWPELTKELFEDSQQKTEEATVPVPLTEEPLISWSEMVEVTQEGTHISSEPIRTSAINQEKGTKQPIEESPILDPSDIHAVEEKDESPIIDIKEPLQVEEDVHAQDITEEIIPEYFDTVQELPQVEEADISDAVPEHESNHGLEGLGPEGFMPEGATVMGEMESQQEEGYVDLSSELGLEDALDFLTESWAPDEKGKETFAEFKHGVEKQLSKEDTETHYNLGIAYMEMELLDDAMREFKIALKNPAFEFDCYVRLGLSLRTKGDYEESINTFLKGINVSLRTDEDRKGLLYELGLTYEAAGKTSDALDVFKSVYVMDKVFREVSYKIQELKIKPTEEANKNYIPLNDDMLEVELL